MRTRRLTTATAPPYPRPMIEVDGAHNLHTLDSYGGPLGVECRCGRRALVPPEALGAHAGNMREIRRLKFVCRECGSREWRGFIFGRHDDALGWARRAAG